MRRSTTSQAAERGKHEGDLLGMEHSCFATASPFASRLHSCTSACPVSTEPGWVTRTRMLYAAISRHGTSGTGPGADRLVLDATLV